MGILIKKPLKDKSANKHHMKNIVQALGMIILIIFALSTFGLFSNINGHLWASLFFIGLLFMMMGFLMEEKEQLNMAMHMKDCPEIRKRRYTVSSCRNGIYIMLVAILMIAGLAWYQS